MSHPNHTRCSRRGAVIVLTALLMVFLLGVVAFSIDLGYIVLVRCQLQNAADSAAMAATATLGGGEDAVLATAQEFAGYHVAGGKSVELADTDVEFGTWDSTTLAFTPTDEIGNAVRITARRDDTTGGNNHFFGRIFGRQTFSTQVSAVAMGNPRDICLVVDLSGSMNDDTEPCWAINEMTGAGHGTVATQMLQDLYTDFGFGTAPGTLQWVGAPMGVTADNRAYANLTKNSGPLTPGTIAAWYRILSTDNESTRKTKGYRWMIDYQIAAVMPLALPTPNSTTNYSYWEKYLDYIIESTTVNSGSGTPPNNRGALPPSQDTDRISIFNNPNTASYPSAGTTVRNSFRNRIGYQTYVQFMMDFGRNLRPDGVTYTPLSRSSANCPYHSESTAGGTFSFPPREQPIHASRRSLIAAIQAIKDHNDTVPEHSQRDWVSIISFDTVSGSVVRQSLTSDYDAAMATCATFQAVADDQNSTAAETGLLLARQHISKPAQGGVGRIQAQKVVVFITDGMPNLTSSTNSTINSYVTGNPSANFYSSGGNYPGNGALMQTMTMQLQGWKVFSVGLGLGTEYEFMDRVARMGDTANDDGEGPRTSGDPGAYELELTEIFENIITNPQVHLVR